MKKIINICDNCKKEDNEDNLYSISTGEELCETCFNIFSKGSGTAFERYKAQAEFFNENVHSILTMLERTKDSILKEIWGIQGIDIKNNLKKYILQNYEKEINSLPT